MRARPALRVAICAVILGASLCVAQEGDPVPSAGTPTATTLPPAGPEPLAADAPLAQPTAPVAPAPTADGATPPGADVLRDGRGLWTHDRHRFGQKWNLVGGLFLRTLMDLVAIPSGMAAWDWLDWTVFSGTIAATVALSLPLSPSPDVQLQRALQRALGGPDHFKLWTTYGDMFIWMGIWGSVASMFLYGITADAPEYVEVPALVVEAFAVTQLYHLGIKALTGREGPHDEVTPGETTGEGRYFGPAGFARLFPSGTPSGHVATMYAMASVVMHYFNTPGVWIALHTFALLFSVTIIADNYHWASDVILGAALGFCVGRWVVHHRSTKFRNDEGGLPRRILSSIANRATITPTVMPGGGFGGAVVVRF
ncbi:MAG: phosphatase PAP2 family protein [Myxococcota bacterium]